MVRLLRDTQRIRATWLRGYVKTLRKNVGWIGLKRGGEPIEKIKRTRNGFYIHTFKSCCFYSTADSWDDERDFKQPKSVECHLQFVCYWWWCSAQSLMISPKHGTTQKLRPVLPGHPDRLWKERSTHRTQRRAGSVEVWRPDRGAQVLPCSVPSWPRCRHRLRLQSGGAQRHHFSFLPCTPPSPAPIPCAPVAGLCQHQPGFVAIKHDSMRWKNTRCSSGIAPRSYKAPVKWVLCFFCFIIFVWACCSPRVGNKY